MQIKATVRTITQPTGEQILTKTDNGEYQWGGGAVGGNDHSVALFYEVENVHILPPGLTYWP